MKFPDMEGNREVCPVKERKEKDTQRNPQAAQNCLPTQRL
jgi:hypothetical protein